jgi:hypothetical protein
MSNFNDVLNQYIENKNRFGPYYLTDSQYNVIKQLVRIQLAELIDNDANDKMIGHFTKLDVSLTEQHESNLNDRAQKEYDEEAGDLPF